MASEELSQQWNGFFNSCTAREVDEEEVKAMYDRAAHGYDEFMGSLYTNQ